MPFEPAQIASVVFDLDGTLLDSLGGAAATLNAVLAHHGRPALPAADVARMVGEGGRRTIELGLEATGGATGIDLDAAFALWTRAYAASDLAATPPFPGVVPTLARLADAGLRLGVCTNKSRAVTIPLLDAIGLAPFFAATVTPDDTPHRKPDGRHILATVAALGGDPATSIYVGDSEIDAEAAADAKVRFVLMSYGYRRGPIAAIKADAVLDRFEELEGLLIGAR